MFVVEGYLHQSDNTVAFGPFDDEASAREFVSKLISEHQCEDINITKVNSPMTHPRLWVADSKEWIEESARGVVRETRHIDKDGRIR